MPDLPQYKTVAVSDLVPYARNARTHSPQQVDKIAASIREFGFLNPIIADGQNGIIAGHGRVLAAQKLGLDVLPVIEASHLTDAQRRAYVLADNRLALDAGWDNELLKIELQDLEAEGFNLELTGFELEEIADLTVDKTEGLTDEDAVPEAPETPVSQIGDVWLMGRHRLMCGDSTSVDAVERLMAGGKADMVFTDPPYGISVVGGAKARNGSIGGAGKVKAGEYRAVIGDDEDYNPLHIFLCFPDAKYILWGANYYSDKLPVGGRWFVWDKNRGEGTTFSDCELAWSNIKGIVVKKYKVTWDGMNREGENGKRVHPTQKPVLLSEKILTDFHHEKSIVDLFGGSGSTLIACEKTARACRMMELDPKYCDVIIKRWQDFTGLTATLEGDGRTFAEIADERIPVTA
jgi:16S rRNA G966 N2-methylase RsmD